MRTTVVRVDVDRAGELTPAQLRDGMTTLRGLADDLGAGVWTTTLRPCRPAGARWSC